MVFKICYTVNRIGVKIHPQLIRTVGTCTNIVIVCQLYVKAYPVALPYLQGLFQANLKRLSNLNRLVVIAGSKACHGIARMRGLKLIDIAIVQI